MSNTEKTPEQAAPALTDVQLLDQLLSLTKEARALRKKQIWVSVLGVLAILVILGIFGWNLVNFGRDFDQEELIRNTGILAGELLRDPNVAALQSDAKEVLYPALKKEFAAKFQANLPQYQEALQKEADRTLAFIQNDLHKKMLKTVNSCITKAEKDLVKKYGDKVQNTTELEQSFKDLEAKLTVKLSDTLESKLSKATDSLASLNRTFEQYKETPDYKTMASLQTDDVENRLIESFLELWIYSLNPARGEANVMNSNGGI